MSDNGGWNPLPNNTARTTPVSTPRALGEKLWCATNRNGRVMVCELRDDSRADAGWEVLLRVNGEIVLGHRSDTEDVARYFAAVFKQDHLRTSWTQRSNDEDDVRNGVRRRRVLPFFASIDRTTGQQTTPSKTRLSVRCRAGSFTAVRNFRSTASGGV